MSAEALIAIVTVLMTVFGVVIAAIGTFLTWWGLNQWKRQKEYEVHYEIARKFSMLAEKFNEIFPYAQSPVGPSPDEYKDRPKNPNEQPEDTRRYDSQYGHLFRLEPLRLIIVEMRELNWESKATIGIDFKPYIDKYIEAISQMRSAIRMVFSPSLDKYYDSGDRDKRLEIYHSNEGILYGGEEGILLRNMVSKNTEELTAKLAKYTFRGKKYNTPQTVQLSKELQRVSNPIELKNQVVDLQERLNTAQKRLSEIENLDADDNISTQDSSATSRQ